MFRQNVHVKALRALICIPTYNERDNVKLLIDRVLAHCPPTADLLFVDDGSPDGTGAFLDTLAAENSRVFVLHRKGKLGLATAYLQAFAWGLARDYDWFFEMDADFSHDAAHLPAFFEKINSGKYQAVCGSRYIPGGGVTNWSQFRYLLSRCGSLYTSFWLRESVTDWTGGYNSWGRSCLESLSLHTVQSRGYTFQIELKYRALRRGFPFVEVPIVFQERRFGQSKMSGDIVKEALWGVVKLRVLSERTQLF